MAMMECPRCHKGQILWFSDEYRCAQCGYRPKQHEVFTNREVSRAQLEDQVAKMHGQQSDRTFPRLPVKNGRAVRG